MIARTNKGQVPTVAFGAGKKTAKDRYWSGDVTRNSRSLDLEEAVFTWDQPRKIALSLKRSAEASTRRKSEPFRSAMSMLTFYINRAGRNLPATRRAILNQAKSELRKAFGRPCWKFRIGLYPAN
jgi:hypothetical protein